MMEETKNSERTKNFDGHDLLYLGLNPAAVTCRWSCHHLIFTMVLQGIAQSVLSLPAITNLSLVAVALLALVYLFLCPQEAPASKSDDSPPQLLLPVGKIAQSFFETPFEFLADGFRSTSSSIFQFKLFQHAVTAVSGDEARSTFFREKGLNLYEGFQVIVGTVRVTHETIQREKH